jgi:hypothetical protein
MTVHFFEIRDCRFEMFGGRPVIFAPEEADEELLGRYAFVKIADGRRVRYLNQYEYSYIMSVKDAEEIVFDGKAVERMNYPAAQFQYVNYGNRMYNPQKTADTLCYVSLGLMAGSLPLSAVLTPLGGLVLAIAALVLVIIVRVHYPEHKLGKVLFTVYLILIIIGVVLTIAAMIIIAIACNQCINDCRSCPG